MDRVLPESVLHADGRVEPFEPERITRSLFAAAEQLGTADAFLARELTEGVLHFLAADHDGSEIASKEIAETVIKVVRELGHPDLAKAFEQGEVAESKPSRTTVEKPLWPAWLQAHTPPNWIVHAAASVPLEALSLAHVFPPELVSAHVEGLIRLSDLATPLELSGLALPIPPDRILQAVHGARELAGEFLAIDGPEYDLAAQPGEPADLAAVFLEELSLAATLAALQVVLNLNIQTPPPRLEEGAGPLFAAEPVESHRHKEIAIALADRARESCFWVWWHLAAGNSNGFAQLPAAGEFVFDRPRGPIHLAPGIDRQTPTTLIQVGLNLSRLVELSRGGAASRSGTLPEESRQPGTLCQDRRAREARLSAKAWPADPPRSLSARSGQARTGPARPGGGVNGVGSTDGGVWPRYSEVDPSGC